MREFKSAIGALHHRRFLITVRGEVMESFAREESLHLLVKEFFARVCLESFGLPGVCPLKELLEGGEHLLTRIVLDRDGPCSRAEDVDHCNYEFRTLVLAIKACMSAESACPCASICRSILKASKSIL